MEYLGVVLMLLGVIFLYGIFKSSIKKRDYFYYQYMQNKIDEFKKRENETRDN